MQMIAITNDDADAGAAEIPRASGLSSFQPAVRPDWNAEMCELVRDVDRCLSFHTFI